MMLAALFLLELIARIVMPSGAPYLITFTAGEPMIELEKAGLYEAVFCDWEIR